MDKYKKDKERYGDMDCMSDYLLLKGHSMIACKEMVEALIGLPVNLGKDGKVTVGF